MKKSRKATLACCLSAILLSISILIVIALNSSSMSQYSAVAAQSDDLVDSKASGNGEWTMFTYNYQDSRFNPHSGINATNVAKLTQRWGITTNSTVSSTPIVSNGMVYFSDWGGDVFAVYLNNGSVKWKHNFGSNISSTLALANGLVYGAFGPFGPTKVFALAEENGTVVWEDKINSTMPSIWASPIIYKDMLFIGLAAHGTVENNASEKGEIDALNASTGAFIWRFNTMVGKSGGASVWGTVALDPVLHSIYFGTGNAFTNSNSTLYSYSILSVNLKKGTLNWYYQVYNSRLIGNDLDFGSTPNLFTVNINGTFYHAVGLGGKNGIYYVLDRTNGRLLENFSVSVRGIIGAGGFIYKGNSSNPEVFIPATSIINSTCHGEVSAIFPSTGSFAWRFYSPACHIFGSVTIVHGAVLFGDTDGNLYALSTKSGKVLFVKPLPSLIESGVTAAEGYVLVTQGTATGYGVIAFSPAN